MIPAISEYTRVGGTRYSGLWLDQARTKKATLHQATVQFEEMGERTITTQIKVDGSIAPSFNGWELEFRGETFVLPTLKPQAAKDNTSRNSMIDLVFTSAPVNELKRYFFAEMSEIEVGTIIIDKYVATLRLNLTNFVAAFNRVLNYYYPNGEFVMDLASGVDTGEVKEFPIDYMYIWDVLEKFFEIYQVSWRFQRVGSVTHIKVGYEPESIDDHVFQYGFDGGLLRFERHVEDPEICNVLLGRGGEKNLPYRYFKYTDPFNTGWAADPDAIKELENVFFSRLLDSNFRNYVQGWKTNPLRQLNQGESVETYDASRGATDWAYAKGHTDTKFDPVEYVKDDDSIALYGVRQGKLDDNDDIFPTIQGVDFPDDNPDIGRVDEVVGVYITDEESQEAVYDQKTDLPDLYTSGGGYSIRLTLESADTFTIPAGRMGRIEYAWMEDDSDGGDAPNGKIDTVNSELYVKDTSNNRYGFNAIPPGTYHYCVDLIVDKMTGAEGTYIVGKYGIWDIVLHCTPTDQVSYRQVFTVWIKNLWQSTQQAGESDEDYAKRIWNPILGDKLGSSAAIHFSDGFMSVSEDYEFIIQKRPEVDRTKSLNGVPSEWKLTLLRSDAEYETTGLYIPNTQTGGTPIPGDHFFFTGVDLPILYVIWAEKRLTESKEASLDENAWTNPTWVITLDKIKAHENGGNDYAGVLADRLDAGVIVAITDPRFVAPNTALQLGVRSITFTWNEPSNKSPYIIPDIEVVLTDKIVRTISYDGVKHEVNYISQNYATKSSVKKMSRSVTNTTVAIDGKINYLGPVIGTVEI